MDRAPSVFHWVLPETDLTTCSPSLTPLQSHWPPSCLSHPAGLPLPQGLYTCFLCPIPVFSLCPQNHLPQLLLLQICNITSLVPLLGITPKMSTPSTHTHTHTPPVLLALFPSQPLSLSNGHLLLVLFLFIVSFLPLEGMLCLLLYLQSLEEHLIISQYILP